ncbi:MAG: N-acetylmuramoyl-L-alanine amidase [Flavobacteriales bacterium]|nr:N-acetylmuramoyl-L-alanine amidase [Flavobacteriales bacterium]MDW8431851.1 N-acetylmuramoyl-L-alanine amidase [Flavobacteriales bacterium]
MLDYRPKNSKHRLAIAVALGLLVPGFLYPERVGEGSVPVELGKAWLSQEKVDVVVIDPGHGGKDPGCHGASAREKDVALAIGLALGALIETHYPDVKVVYTRKTDVFVELHNRARIANEAHGDLFICIHCNAGSPEAHGSETYALGLHRSATNLAVAKRENEAILLEDNYKENYMGFDINSPEGSIIFSLIQNTFLNRSLLFAAKCQKNFRTLAGRMDRGVKQAGFLVLVYTAMPSVLIETGFLTHKQEEAFLADRRNQELMAEAIFRAFAEYKSEIEKKPLPEKLSARREDPPPVNLSASSSDAAGSLDSVAAPPSEAHPLPKVFLSVQFSALPGKRSMPPTFRHIPEVFSMEENSMTKFFSGRLLSLSEAEKRRSLLMQYGYKDAFIVGFSEGNKTTASMAIALLQQKKD